MKIEAIAEFIQCQILDHWDKDITVVLTKQESLELLCLLNEDSPLHDSITMDVSLETDYCYVSSLVCDCCDTDMLIIEDVMTTHGEVKRNDTNLMLVSSEMPAYLINSFFNDSDFEVLIKVDENTDIHGLLDIFCEEECEYGCDFHCC